MESFLANTVATLRNMIAGLPEDPLWWAKAAAIAAVWGSLVYTAWRVRTVAVRLGSLIAEVGAIREAETHVAAEDRREALALLRGAQFYLQHINERLGSTLPPDVKVASISAENLVVGPATAHGQHAD